MVAYSDVFDVTMTTFDSGYADKPTAPASNNTIEGIRLLAAWVFAANAPDTSGAAPNGYVSRGWTALGGSTARVSDKSQQLTVGPIPPAPASTPYGEPHTWQAAHVMLTPGYRMAVQADNPNGFWMLNPEFNSDDLGSWGLDASTVTATLGTRAVGKLVVGDFGGYVEIPDDNRWPSGATGKLTIEVVCRLDALPASQAHIISKYAVNQSEWSLYVTSTGQLIGLLWAAGGQNILSADGSVGGININTDYHITLTIDRGAPRIETFINGVSHAFGTAGSGTWSNGTAPVNIGRRGDNNFGFDGAIGGVAAYDKILSQSQIAKHAASVGIT